MAAIDSKAARELPEPIPEWCPPLRHNLGDSEGAPGPGHFGTPRRFHQWLTNVWRYPVRPHNFRPANFTRHCLMIDPFGRLHGADWCSTYFHLLFLLFPDLSGKHLSWAANKNTIVINWGFFTTNGEKEIFVPSLDIYGFENGLVNYHLATFDRVALANALVQAYPDSFHWHHGETLQQRIWLWHVAERLAIEEYEVLTKLQRHAVLDVLQMEGQRLQVDAQID